MIKLDVQEYCHGCANFTADVKEPEKYYAGFDIIERQILLFAVNIANYAKT